MTAVETCNEELLHILLVHFADVNIPKVQLTPYIVWLDALTVIAYIVYLVC